MSEPHGREPSTTENCSVAGTCPGARLGTDEVHLHRGPTELTRVGASALPLPFEAPNSAREPLPTLLTDPRGPPSLVPLGAGDSYSCLSTPCTAMLWAGAGAVEGSAQGLANTLGHSSVPGPC